MAKSLKFKTLLSTACLCVMSIIVTGCFSSENNQTSNGEAFIEAQTQSLALDFEQHAIQAAHLITNHASWKTQTFTQGEVIDFAALGGMPTADNSVNADFV